MRVKITRQPLGTVHGVSLKHYRPGVVYELPPALAEYLVMEGYATLEMRTRETPTAIPKEDRGRRD